MISEKNIFNSTLNSISSCATAYVEDFDMDKNIVLLHSNNQCTFINKDPFSLESAETLKIHKGFRSWTVLRGKWLQR